MKYLKIILSVLVLFLFTVSIFGQGIKSQEIINNALAKETIKNQFEILLSKSNNFQQFKNIKLYNINKFRTNFLDTLKAIDIKFTVANTKISTQKSEIEKLKSEIATINGNLNMVTDEKDNIGLFGIKTTKHNYNLILWSIICALLATTLFLSFRYKSSNRATKQAKTSFAEVENEFETHKKKSLEREQVLRRKLQDEINKKRNVS